MIDYALHFLGGFVIFVVFVWFESKRPDGGFYLRPFLYTLSYAVLWEIAQLDVFWNACNYKLICLAGYDWINNGLDVLSACAGAAVVIGIIELLNRICRY